MMILYLFMILVFTTYVSWIWAKYGVQESISHSYYILPTNQKMLFTFWCWGYALPAILISSNFLMFLAGSAICFVGAAAAYQEKLTGTVHAIGAYLGVLFSQLSIIINFNLWPISVIFAILTLPLMLSVFSKKNIFPNRVWWAEILAFISIATALGIKFL